MTAVRSGSDVEPELPAFDLKTWGIQVRVVVTDPDVLAAVAVTTRDWLDRVDRACSRFRDDSDLVHVNHAGGRAVQVNPVLRRALGAAMEAARVTGGLVTPTVGQALCEAGYDRTFALVGPAGPTDIPRPMTQPRPAPQWQAIEIDEGAGTVRIPRGYQLDLGATTKAWAADQLAERLASDLGCGILVDLGGDVVAAGEAPEGGWLVQVTDGPRASANGPMMALWDGALATSSTVIRRWVADGAARHHIIDPSTGLPADDLWRTVTVHAAHCFDANAVSTAAVILGDRALPWLSEVELPARLVRRDGLVMAVNGWSEDEWEAVG